METSGGVTPIPRKLMLASASTALLNPIVIAGSSTWTVLGSMCTIRILSLLAPMSLALII